MKRKRAISLLHPLLLLTLVLLGANSAHATFPGKNGRIAFVFGPDIYSMNPDGSDVRQLTNLGPENSASWESWSPDGKQIVFCEFPPPDFHGQLWLMNADGSNQHVLLAEPGITEVRPSFSPDGKTIAFSRGGPDYNPDNGNPFVVEIYRIGVDGTGLTAITRHDTIGVHDYGPKYSPDGTAIVFQGDDRDGILGAAWVIDADGTKIRQVTASPISGRRPDWSPDGKKIAFQTHCCNPQNETIALVNADGNGLRELTHNGNDYDAGPHDFNPSWSPEGDTIVFERHAPDFSSSAIVVITADGQWLAQKMLPPASHFPAAQSITSKHDLIRNRTRNARLHQIEEGGTLPRWGPATN